jgi:hypothetical protein
MTKTEPLAPGNLVQYLKVGQARLVSYDGYSSPRDIRESGEGYWTVEWIKAPKKYREGGPELAYWFTPKDRI